MQMHAPVPWNSRAQRKAMMAMGLTSGLRRRDHRGLRVFRQLHDRDVTRGIWIVEISINRGF